MTELGINGQAFSPIGEQQGAAGSAFFPALSSRIRHKRVTYGVGSK
jgi:hypothetical protein